MRVTDHKGEADVRNPKKPFTAYVFRSYMRRWNDKLRPVELYEIDKQAHKMIVAWMLTLLNSGGYSASDQLKLQQEVIERGLFDYLYRLVTTDIKPPVFYRICENEKDYKELTEWVLKELRPVLGAPDEGFWERLSAYEPPGSHSHGGPPLRFGVGIQRHQAIQHV